MARYSYVRLGATPTAGSDNWTIDVGSAATRTGRILEFGYGGGATTSTAMRTRLARPTTNGVTGGAALTSTKLHPNHPTVGAVVSTTWSTQPVLAADTGVFGVDWNAHGGVVRWLAAPGEEIQLIGSSTAGIGQISCRADTGTGTSSYNFIYEED